MAALALTGRSGGGWGMRPAVSPRRRQAASAEARCPTLGAWPAQGHLGLGVATTCGGDWAEELGNAGVKALDIVDGKNGYLLQEARILHLLQREHREGILEASHTHGKVNGGESRGSVAGDPR